MLEKNLVLSQLDDVKKFVDIASSKDYDIELLSGRYIVNAKSIMGVFSLDLTKPITMHAHCEQPGELLREIRPFIVEQEK